MTCGNRHPDYSDIICDVKVDNHPRCSGLDPDVLDYVDWQNPGYEPPKKSQVSKQATREKLADIASRVRSDS